MGIFLFPPVANQTRGEPDPPILHSRRASAAAAVFFGAFAAARPLSRGPIPASFGRPAHSEPKNTTVVRGKFLLRGSCPAAPRKVFGRGSRALPRAQGNRCASPLEVPQLQGPSTTEIVLLDALDENVPLPESAEQCQNVEL